MADIFISYKREDQEQKGRVLPIVRALEAEGFDVFYDVEIPPGSTWEQVLSSKINASKCVLVLWSEASINSDWVKEEAEIAKNGGKIIPVFLDPVAAPFGFGRIEGANLANWNGDLTHIEWKNLIAAVKAKVGGGTGIIDPTITRVPISVEPTSKPARQGGGAMKAIVAVLALAVIGIGGFFGYQMLDRKSGTPVAREATVENLSVDRDKRAFEKASAEDTIKAYDLFLKTYPTSGYAKDAKDRRNQLAEIERRKKLAEAEAARQATRQEASFTEDCLNYSGSYDIRVSSNGQLAQLVDVGQGGTPLAARGSNAKAEMERALFLVQKYGLTQQCFVDRPNPPLSYWKTSDGKIPVGDLPGEDCVGLDRNALNVRLRGGMYYVFEGSRSLLRFDDDASAQKAIAILKANDATDVCYIGRPDPSMIYIRGDL